MTLFTPIVVQDQWTNVDIFFSHKKIKIDTIFGWKVCNTANILNIVASNNKNVTNRQSVKDLDVKLSNFNQDKQPWADIAELYQNIKKSDLRV